MTRRSTSINRADVAGDRVFDPADLQTELLSSKRARLAQRRDQPVACERCGRTVRRKSRHQKFCSRRCRVSAHRAKTVAQPIKNRPRYPHTGDETKTSKIASNSSRLRKRFSGPTPHISGPQRVIDVEVYGGRTWQRVVSIDGVVCGVARLHKRISVLR
jgi:hypothetical protein